jgi:hypothetical protein
MWKIWFQDEVSLFYSRVERKQRKKKLMTWSHLESRGKNLEAT